MEEAYHRVIWDLPDDYLSRETFEKVLYDLDWKSSPGYPYNLEKPTIGEWLGLDRSDFTLNPVAVDRLWSDVQVVISGNYEHIFKVFVKSEPHNARKVRENRWRLIIASSLPVQVVWNMCFRYLQTMEIENAYRIPSQQGVALNGGVWKYYRNSWVSRGFNVGLDKSAWDWTFPAWILDLDLILCYRLGRGSKMDEWYRVVEWLHNDAFKSSRLLFSDGRIFQQTVPGFMKSGLYCTISKNSRGTVMAHIFNSLYTGLPVEPLPVAVGDDSLQREEQATDLSGYEKMGVVVKSVTKGLEFVGHNFTERGPVPVYVPRHLCAFMTTEDQNLEQYLDQMARMYCHDDHMFNAWTSMAKRLGINVHSQRYYLAWYDYEGL